ncbi:MAG TPA: CvpA family protein [Gaiellaceae bacterium]|nr:CvpA family protein [Gaiellaceae bacterium]
MTKVDWIALAIVALSALAGLRRGLIATAFSLGGLAAGAVVGARLAPQLLHNGSASPWTPVAGLVGAVVGASLLSGIASMIGSSARKALFVLPPLRMLDTLGGVAAGAALGLVVVWVAAAAALQIPDQPKLRSDVLQSKLVRRLNQIAPPRSVLRAFARIDPLPSIAGPAPPTTPPDTRVLQSAAVVAARPSVVQITDIACGLGVEGSGWVARPHIVVTAAHVVAGAKGITADGHAAQALVVDRKEDVAVLRVPGLDAPALPIADPHSGDSVAILGYPEDGPFDARPGRIGATADVLDAGNLREVTAISGLIRHGNSGGPAVNENGAVEATIFAARIGTEAGYGIPAAPVRADLDRARGPVSTGSSCG